MIGLPDVEYDGQINSTGALFFNKITSILKSKQTKCLRLNSRGQNITYENITYAGSSKRSRKLIRETRKIQINEISLAKDFYV